MLVRDGGEDSLNWPGGLAAGERGARSAGPTWDDGKNKKPNRTDRLYGSVGFKAHILFPCCCCHTELGADGLADRGGQADVTSLYWGWSLERKGWVLPRRIETTG